MKRISDLSNKLYEGGEAEIFQLSQGQLAKIYKPIVDKVAKLEKIKHLLGIQLPLNCSYPQDILADIDGNFIGFSMKELNGEVISKLSNRKHIRISSISKKDIAKLLVNLFKLLQEINSNHIFIGDLNDNNVLYIGANAYFIDVDSWHFQQFPCTAINPLFADPLNNSNSFTKETDSYAYAVLAFKALTRIHPFGGVYGDMTILDRIQHHISVFNKDVIIPPTVDGWDFLPPSLIQEFKQIFEHDNRDTLDLSTFADNAFYCSKHGDYYYGYNRCPLCFDITLIPVKVGIAGIKQQLVISNKKIKQILDISCWLMLDDTIYFPELEQSLKFNKHYHYYRFKDSVVIDKADVFIIGDSGVSIRKLHNSRILIRDQVFYISPAKQLIQLDISSAGTIEHILSDCSFRHIFEAYNKQHYFICNIYDNFKVLNIDGYTSYMPSNTDDIVDWGIHFDKKSKHWLFIYTNQNDVTKTSVFDKHNVVFTSDSIKYQCQLSNICYDNGIIYFPGDKHIIGFNHANNTYKEFQSSIVDNESRLQKKLSKITVVNDTEVYELGN